MNVGWLRSISVVACVLVAAVLAFNRTDNWGWFLLAALLLS